MVKRFIDYEMVLTTEWAQVEVIDLTNDGNGLGFNIVGGKSTGVVIKYVVPGSVADKDGRLQGGDHVLQVGAVNLRGFSSEQVASVLRQTGDQVRLLVARPIDPNTDDYTVLGNHAPIVPTKILSDPEQLDRHLIENGYNDTYNAIPQCYEEQFDENEAMNGTQQILFPVAAFVDVVGKNPMAIGEPTLIMKPTSPIITVSMPPDAVPRLPSPPEMEIITVSLSKNVYGLGVTVAGYVCEKEELSGIFVKSIIEGSAAELSGKIKINDRIITVDGESLIGKTNHQAVEILRNTNISVTLVLERYLRGPKYEHLQSALWREDSPPSPPSPSVTTLSWFQVLTDNAESTIEMEPESHTTIDSTILEPEEEEPCPESIEKELDAQLDITPYKEKWGEYIGADKDIIVADISKLSGLGISLEGTVDVEGGQELRPHHYIRSILPQGPVGLHGALKAGDELLQVNDHSLHELKHPEVVSILKELPSKVRLVCARSSIDMGPRPLINVSQDREGFETRKIISGSLHNIAALIKSHSESSINTSSTATLTDHSISKKSHSLECVSNLAMWNEEEVFIELVKSEQGLGFSILDYQDPVDPEGTVIVVRSLVPGGAAEKQGQIAPGDRLLSVNSISIRNVTLDQAVYALKSAPLGIVCVGIARPLPSNENCNKSLQSSISGSLQTKISS